MSNTVYVEKLVVENGQMKWESQAVVVNTEDEFSIDELELNREICRMGQLLLQYGDLAAELDAELKRKEEALKYTAARIAGAERSSAEANGDKMTEGKLNEKVITHSQYQAELAALHVTRAYALQASNWWRTANNKAKLLETLAFRQSAELRRGAH